MKLVIAEKPSVAMALASWSQNKKRWLRGGKRLYRFLVRRTSGGIMRCIGIR
jgi:DNA topoisomerase IA